MIKREKLYNKLRNMKQNASLSEEELYKIVDVKLEEEEVKEAFSRQGLKGKDLTSAIERYNIYIEQSSFENLAEKSSLINLICLEILKEKLSQFIVKETTDKNGAVPGSLAEKMIELDTRILESKEKLGLLTQKEANSLSQALDELYHKAEVYYNEHAGEFYTKCPYCNTLYRCLRPIENTEIVKATFFKGTTLYNQPLFELYHNKVITKAKMAEIFGVNEKYIDFIYEELFLKEKNDKQN